MNIITKLTGKQQQHALLEILKGEERDAGVEIIERIEADFAKMPLAYETDGQGKAAIAYLHYFKNGFDWYITEKDEDGGTNRCFGLCCLFEKEIGYVSIPELLASNVELDFHWTPKPLSECWKER